MKTFITSDLHFGHANIMKFCPDTRAHYDSVDQMTECMIADWNREVEPEDGVYILGDVAFCNPEQAVKILNRLNGRKILIIGNHDRKNIKDHRFRYCFEEIHDYLVVTHNNTKLVMFHFPIMEWEQCHRGSVHLYGHLHQNDSGLEHLRARNVGFDYTGKIVSLLDDVIVDALKGSIKGHGDSKESM